MVVSGGIELILYPENPAPSPSKLTPAIAFKAVGVWVCRNDSTNEVEVSGASAGTSIVSSTFFSKRGPSSALNGG